VQQSYHYQVGRRAWALLDRQGERVEGKRRNAGGGGRREAGRVAVFYDFVPIGVRVPPILAASKIPIRYAFSNRSGTNPNLEVI
jgi:hypothetical protein